MMKYEELWNSRKKLLWKHDLIHCITNPISMNDCANAVLALGAKPIMAQHPDEVEEITKQSKALALNLGNFDDIRKVAMWRSLSIANTHQIPVILDLVGVGCSSLRLSYAKKMIAECCPNVIKGNLSEIRAIAGKTSHAKGIDVGIADIESELKSATWIKAFAKQHHCVVLCSGKHDIISDGDRTYVVENGCEMMTLCTGTGCMLNVITASFLSVLPSLEASVMACSYFGVVAQQCHVHAKAPGSFHYQLFDWLYSLSEQDFMEHAKISEVTV